MSKFAAKAQAYINYINDIKDFKNIPLWRRQLNAYNQHSSKPVSLAPTDKEACLKAYNSLPSANYYSQTFSIDTLDEFIDSIT